MFRMVRITIAVGVVVLQAATLMARPRPRVVTVDCDRRGSINAALDATTPPVIIEFRGTCNETIVIADDDVTLRGAIGSGAAVVGTASRGIEIIGGDRVTLENFRVTNTEGTGIYARDGSHVVLDRIDASGSAGSGFIIETGGARLWSSTFNDNGVDGISAWNDSMITLLGTIEASRNDRAGIVVSSASLTTEYRNFHGARVDGNRWGVAVQNGAHATIMTAAAPFDLTGNRDEGLSLWGTSSFSGPINVSGSRVGIWAHTSVFESYDAQVTGADIAVLGDLGSSLTLGDAVIAGNDTGILLDAATLQMFDGTLSGNSAIDLSIMFGSHVSLHRLTPGTISCDGSVNVLRGVTCGSPARTPRLTTHGATHERPAPRAPFAIIE